MPSKYTAFDVARYFLSKVNTRKGDDISNLKLQKLVYFAQGYYLALFNKPLFNDEIEAWIYGPVVPALYRRYKKYEKNAIPAYAQNALPFDDKVKEFLDEIYRVFGCYSITKLVNMSHNTMPWKDTEICGVITHAKMKAYFRTMLK